MSAIQQSAVTQVTSPGNSNYDPYYSNVSLLLSMNGSNNSTSFVDASPDSNIITVNSNAKISTAQFKFGGSSARFNGTADYLTTVDSTLAWGTGDFTVELWMYTDDQIGATQRGPLQTSTTPGGFSTGYTTGIAIFQGSNRNNAPMDGGLIVNIAGTNVGSNSPVISIGVWTHVAIVRSSGNATLYINGTSVDSRTANGSITGTNLVIGGYYSNLFYYIGYIDDLRITSGIARYTANFTVPAYANPLTGPNYDPFYNNVSLLLHCNGTNASTNFIDNSGSPKTVTANGNAQISTAQWRFGGSSAYFNGINAGLTISANNDFTYGTGDFTLEAWIYTNVVGATAIISHGTGEGPNLYLYLNGLTPTVFFNGTGVASGPSVTLSAWSHVAVSRQGTSFRVFTNGVSGTLVVNSTSFTNTGLYIGVSSVSTQFFNGYIDDLRITKGVARYTTNFTPPRLAYADSGPNFDPYYDQVTLLLPFNGANASTSFIDNSKTANIISVTGNTQISTAQSKFGGSSVYFDGNIDWLSLPSTNINFQSSDFTIEFWIYRTSNALGTAFSMARDQSGTGYGPVRLDFTSSLTVRPLIGNSDNTGWASTATGTATIALNTWGHYALVKTGTTIRQYINGVLDLTLTSMPATFSNVSRDVTIGYNNSTDGQYLTGYLDDFRITKGVARYTSNFTVPVRPNPTTGIQYDNYYDNVSLLLHMNGPNNGTSFVDNSLRAKTVTATNAVTSTTQYKYGVSSAYFDGAGDLLTVPASNEFNFGTDPWTIECWVRISADASGVIDVIIGNRSTSFLAGQWYLCYVGSNIVFDFRVGGGDNNTVAATGISFDTWYHIAVVRNGTTYAMYKDGVLSQSLTISSSASIGSSSYNISIGNSTDNSFPLNGYIDDLRITKGIARYTANFTPPTQAFPDQGPQTDPFYYNTSLLLHFDGTNASTNIVDNSPVIKSVTPFGNAQISTAQWKFGGSSAYFDGTGDILSISGSQNFVLTNNFTIEGWVYIDSTMVSSRPDNLKIFIFVGWNTGNTPQFYVVGTTTTAGTGIGFYDGTNDFQVAVTIPKDQWVHLAFVRTSSIIYGFVNGTRYTIASSYSTTIGTTDNVVIAGNPNQVANYYSYLKGYMDDIRITNGVARYVNNFTPPQRPFPNQ